MTWILLTMEFTRSWIFGGYHDELRRQAAFPTQTECDAAIVKLHEQLPGLAMICISEPR